MDDTRPDAMYDAFADAFDAHAGRSAYNAFLDRPAVLALAGDVSGLDVLDAGCGPGHYAQALLSAGARVTAFDSSPRMVELTREKVGPTAAVQVADLEEPLDFLDDASFDLIVLALVIHHVDDRVAMLRELRRVLRPDGRLLVSTVHPLADWLRLGGGYYEHGWVEEVWNDGWPVRFWRQPLGGWCREFNEAGFLIERLVEPTPEEGLRESDPAVFEKVSRTPTFVAFALRAPA